jgi:23S rRNA A2030 N6-methylase RlmJ
VAPSKNYDHRRKAGNQGDVFKHVALVAALNEIVPVIKHEPFKYADIFAGYAWNPLSGGRGWKKGIGKIAGKQLLNGNPDVAFWAKCWVDADGKPGPSYHGSSWFAKEVCAHQRKKIEMWLWDTQPGPIVNLKEHFREQASRIFQRAAQVDEPALKDADFIFIDPPDKTRWIKNLELVKRLDSPPRQSVLIWLPVGVNTMCGGLPEDRQSDKCREQALKLGMSVTKVRWAHGGRTIGCQLLYRLSSDAQGRIRSAIDAVAEHVKQGASEFLIVCHYFA